MGVGAGSHSPWGSRTCSAADLPPMVTKHSKGLLSFGALSSSHHGVEPANFHCDVLVVWCGVALGRRKCCYIPNKVLLSFFFAQVLFCYEQFDELTLLHLREFDKKKLISVETDIVVDHYKEEKFEESHPGIVRLSGPSLPPCARQRGVTANACAAPERASRSTPFHSAILML